MTSSAKSGPRHSAGYYRNRRNATRLLVFGILLAGTFLTVVPFVFGTSHALMTTIQFVAYPTQWIPDPLKLSNIADALQLLGWRPFFNSTLLAVCAILGQTIFGMMAAFAIALLRFRFRQGLLLVYISELLVPFHVIMIPLFVLVFRLGWLDTYPGLIVPVVASQSLAVFFFRQAFLAVPHELFEAAVVDGASPFLILRRIYAPLVGPTIAAYAIITFLGAFSLFVWPLLASTKPDLRTVSVQLAIENTSSVPPSNLMAMALLSMLPVLIVFIVAQGRFVQGIAGTGLKG
jgi:multiple sugar transport system permease protein